MEQQDPDEIRDDIDSSPTEEPQEPPITVEPTYKTSEWVMDNFGNGDPLSLTIKRGTEHAGTVTAQVVDTEVGVLKVEFDPAIYVFDKDVQDELAGAIGRRVLPAVHLPRYSE